MEEPINGNKCKEDPSVPCLNFNHYFQFVYKIHSLLYLSHSTLAGSTIIISLIIVVQKTSTEYIAINIWHRLLCSISLSLFSYLLVYGSTNEIMMYRVPDRVVSPSWKCVSRPGCINIVPCTWSRTEQLYRVNRQPPPVKSISLRFIAMLIVYVDESWWGRSEGCSSGR